MNNEGFKKFLLFVVAPALVIGFLGSLKDTNPVITVNQPLTTTPTFIAQATDMLLTNTPIAATTSTQTQCNPGEISLNDALSGSTVCSPITPAPGSLSDVLEGGPMDGGPDNNPFTSDTLPTIIP